MNEENVRHPECTTSRRPPTRTRVQTHKRLIWPNTLQHCLKCRKERTASGRYFRTLLAGMRAQVDHSLLLPRLGNHESASLVPFCAPRHGFRHGTRRSRCYKPISQNLQHVFGHEINVKLRIPSPIGAGGRIVKRLRPGFGNLLAKVSIVDDL